MSVLCRFHVSKPFVSLNLFYTPFQSILYPEDTMWFKKKGKFGHCLPSPINFSVPPLLISLLLALPEARGPHIWSSTFRIGYLADDVLGNSSHISHLQLIRMSILSPIQSSHFMHGFPLSQPPSFSYRSYHTLKTEYSFFYHLRRLCPGVSFLLYTVTAV